MLEEIPFYDAIQGGRIMEIEPKLLLKAGGLYDFLNPEANVYVIDDIAHGLSNICRFSELWYVSGNHA